MRDTAGFSPFLGALLLLAGCESPLESGRDAELTSLPRALSAAEQQVIQGSNTFAFDLLRETARQQPAPNVFLSPLSASMALGMTMNGARGATLTGMRSALGFGELELSAINQSYRDLIALLRGLDRNVDMRVANSIWALEGYPFHEEFLQTNRTYFDAEVSTLQFSAPDAAATINRWVERSTGGRIKEIVRNPIPADVVMYLINAIYFKGDWRYRFDRAQTRDAPFTLPDGSTRTVKMMNRRGEVLVHHDAATDVDVVELLYGRGAFALTIVLPARGDDVNALIAELGAEQWQQWIGALREQEVQLSLPRFRIEYETRMNEPLITLGMAAAFARAPGTDFTGLSPLGRGLYISEVKQKTFVDVNEEGTEAAAATSVAIARTSGPPSVIVDRPFLVALRERFSGAILFLGVIGDPQ